MSKEKEEYNVYETKCRKCGKIHEWVHSKVGQFTSFQIVEAMHSDIQNPSQTSCTQCKMQTVQDVVSYGKRPI